MTRKTDAVMLEIIGNQLLSIAEEMGVAIIKSAYSNNIRNAGIFLQLCLIPKVI